MRSSIRHPHTRPYPQTHDGLGVKRGAGGDDTNFVKVGGRVLQGCSAGWHPQYSDDWAGGYCAFETNCDSPGYSSELACISVAASKLLLNSSSRVIHMHLSAKPRTEARRAYGFQLPNSRSIFDQRAKPNGRYVRSS